MMNNIIVICSVFMLGIVYSDIAQVKYLGGITFLLKDRCPEYASDFEIENYNLCAQNEILHVRYKKHITNKKGLSCAKLS